VKMMKALAAATTASVFLAMLMFAVYQLNLNEWGLARDEVEMEHPVFRMMHPSTLQERDVVNFLKNVPLQHTYDYVKLEDNRIFIDVKADADRQDDVLRDAFQLTTHLLVNTTNIEEMYVRFIDKELSQGTLLIAIAGLKNDRMLQELKENHPVEDYKHFLEEHTQLIYGTGWSN
jgi:hypothetical protein